MPPAIVSVPLLTSQSQSAHPFLVGPGAQTKRSSNIWIDERGRIRRRPAVMSPYDGYSSNYIIGLQRYEHKNRTSRSTDQLVAFYAPSTTDTTDKDRFAGAVMISDHPHDPLRRNATTALYPSKIVLKGTITAHAIPAANHAFKGTSSDHFKHRETVSVYNGATGSGDGSLLGTAEVWVDNVKYSGGTDGNLIIRHASFDISTTFTSNIRIQNTGGSGGNVSFSQAVPSDRPRDLWLSTGYTQADGGDTVWRPDTIPVMQQYGKFLCILDDSFLYPLRIWTSRSRKAHDVISAPRGTIMTSHEGKIFIGGIENNGSLIVGSATYDPYAWDTATSDINGAISLTIEEGDRSEVTGLFGNYFGDLLVWKRNSTHRITGDIINAVESIGVLPFSRVTISPTIGCASHRTIVQAGNDIIWMSSQGVHSLQTTDKFGDVEEAYISFSIAEIFESMNLTHVRKSQAVFEPRLGLYILGIPTDGSKVLNRLLAYSVVSRRWMEWDVGDFTSIGIGPGLNGHPSSVYLSLIDGPDGSSRTGNCNLAVMDFSIQQDLDGTIDATIGAIPSSSVISCVLEPGEVFFAGSDDVLRYSRKSSSRAQVYLTPSGDFTSDFKYSWDGGNDQVASLRVNPAKDVAFGSGFTLGGPNIQGTPLGSLDQVAVASVPMAGTGHTVKFRIEDSNLGHLPYLHSDLLVEVHDPNYTPAVK